VPVKGIFFLVQARKDRVDRVNSAQAVGLLKESVGQVSALMASFLGKEELRAQHLEQFNNLCVLARVIPTHTLRISLTGTFWQEIEQTLGRTS
jgi:SynChlorMet cassette protein ScmC